MRRMLPSVWSSRSMTIVIALGTFVSGVSVTLRAAGQGRTVFFLSCVQGSRYGSGARAAAARAEERDGAMDRL